MPQYWPIPAPVTWAAGDHVTAARLRADVSGTVGFHTARPMFSGTQSDGLGQSIPNTTWTGVTLDNAIYDNVGGHSNTTTPSRYTAQVAGWYLAIGAVAYSSSSTAASNAYISGVRINGSNATLYEGCKLSGANSSLINPAVVELIYLLAGDYVELGAYQGSGAAATLTSSTGGSPAISHRSYLQVIWVCAGTGIPGLAVPSPITWVNGTSQINAATFNAQIRDAARFLTFPPMVRLSYTGSTPAGQALPTGTATAIKWDSSFDPWGGWGGTGSNPTRWVAPVSGRYLCAGYSAVTASTAGKRGVGLRVNGTSTFNGQQAKPITASTHDAGNTVIVTRQLRLTAGDYVEVMGLQTSGSSLTLATGTNSSRFLAVWMGS